MKPIYFVLFLILSLSCHTSKNKKDTANLEENGDLKATIGIVHINENSCPLYIAVENPKENFSKLYPVNLKDNMKKKGLKVKFSYSLSRAMLPEGCDADAVIQIEEITVIP